MNKFLINIKLSSNHTGTYTMTINYDKSIEMLVYDDLLDFLYEEMEKDIPHEKYPDADISEIFILKNENGEEHRYPVLSESEFKNNEEIYSKKYKKTLVLPEYTYTLTPSCKLAMILSKFDLYDIEEFDVDEMDKLYEVLKKLVCEEIDKDKVHPSDNFNYDKIPMEKIKCSNHYY